MSDLSSRPVCCPRCGAPLPDAPGEPCPRCVMAQIALPTEAADAMAAAAPPAPEELAPWFPQLEILTCLGRGGMGVVYKARQKSLNRLVALKLLAPERADDPRFAERFAKEAQALAALNHPHIVGVYDFGEAGGFYFLLMEFVDGLNLRQLLKAKRLTPKEALSIVPPVCEALQCAHEHGIVHRDIKPENLLIDKAGIVKIADFGISKLIDAGAGTSPENVRDIHEAEATLHFGTPDYAAPEQREGRAATDHRADIYSLGVVLYEMLTGERPGKSIVPPSKRVQVDIRIDEIVLQALETAPELRFATAAQFRTRVEAARLPLSKARWPAAKWAAVIGVLLAAAVGAETLRRSLDRTGTDGDGMGSPGNETKESPQTPENASKEHNNSNPLAEFRENLDQLLRLEKESALDTDVPRPGDRTTEEKRQRRNDLLRQLQTRDRELRKALGLPSGSFQALPNPR